MNVLLLPSDFPKDSGALLRALPQQLKLQLLQRLTETGCRGSGQSGVHCRLSTRRLSGVEVKCVKLR